jgi:ABC-2 type transport system ATP-binding protein
MQTLTGLLGAPVHEGTEPVLLTATVPAARSGRPPSEQAATVLAELASGGIAIGEFSLSQPSLDAVFLALTSQSASTPAPPGLSSTAGGLPATSKESS